MVLLTVILAIIFCFCVVLYNALRKEKKQKDEFKKELLQLSQKLLASKQKINDLVGDMVILKCDVKSRETRIRNLQVKLDIANAKLDMFQNSEKENIVEKTEEIVEQREIITSEVNIKKEISENDDVFVEERTKEIFGLSVAEMPTAMDFVVKYDKYKWLKHLQKKFIKSLLKRFMFDSQIIFDAMQFKDVLCKERTIVVEDEEIKTVQLYLADDFFQVLEKYGLEFSKIKYNWNTQTFSDKSIGKVRGDCWYEISPKYSLIEKVKEKENFWLTNPIIQKDLESIELVLSK